MPHINIVAVFTELAIGGVRLGGGLYSAAFNYSNHQGGNNA